LTTTIDADRTHNATASFDLAYRHHRRLARDLPARNAAEATYRERHPTMPEREAQAVVLARYASCRVVIAAGSDPKTLITSSCSVASSINHMPKTAQPSCMPSWAASSKRLRIERTARFA
jgi:hypothetical protein